MANQNTTDVLIIGGGLAAISAAIAAAETGVAVIVANKGITGKSGSSAKAAGILAGVNSKPLLDYAKAIGLAFQIKDDLLDYEGSTVNTGKRVGKDDVAGKATLVSLLGIKEAKEKTHQLCEEACNCLNGFGKSADLLKTAARFTIERGF